jgi:competence protein ComEC
MLAGLWAGILSGGVVAYDGAAAAMAAGVFAAALAVLACPRERLAALCACFFLMGAMRSPEAVRHTPTGLVSAPVVLSIRLPALMGQCADGVRARVDEVRVGDPRLAGTLLAVRGLDPGERRGQRTLLVSGTFHPPEPPRNPMAYDARAAARRQGLSGSLSLRKVLDESCSPADRALASVRRAVHAMIADLPETECRGVLDAVLLGSRRNLDPAVRAVMLKAGTYHVLAISGLHVGILAVMAAVLLTVLRLGRAGRIVAGMLPVLIYVGFTGARPSALRAGAFFVVLGAARLYEQRVDYANCLCFAAVALLVAAPALAWDLGFRLSFAAVLGMTLVLPQASPRPSRPRSLAAKSMRLVESGLLAAFTAQVLTLPLVLWAFGRVSLIACVSNLLVLPLMGLSLAAGLEATVLAVPLPALGAVFMRSASVLTLAAVRLAGLLTSHLNPMVFPGRPHILRVLVYYAVVLCGGIWGSRLGRRGRIAVLGAAFALMLIRFPPAGDGQVLRLTFFDVGSGDACVMELPGGKAVLLDTGPATSDYNAAAAIVIPYLALRGISRLDRVIITHPHNDHYGGLPAILDAVAVGEVLVSTQSGEDEYRAALAAAGRKGTAVRVVRAGHRWTSGEVGFEVLHPGGPDGPGVDVSSLPCRGRDPNAWSLVVRVTLGSRAILTTGDLTPAAQDSLVARGVNLSCDVLKVPHHGHPGETSAGFARALGAEVAVISCGTRFFAEPDTATAGLLAALGMRVLSTRTAGAVSVVTDGEALAVSTVRGGEEYSRQ